jgi:hypothetical protein
VLNADGKSYHWIVSLPSTMDWTLPGDTAATNDLDSNVALMLTPDQQTQYERALMQAMQDAGVPPGADVLFTGFSQGGIMAANLASDPDLPYSCIGVITNGAPIETFDIPADIPVISFRHDADPVPLLDGEIQHLDVSVGTSGPFGPAVTIDASSPNRPNYTEVVLPSPSGGLLQIHNAHNYAASVGEYLAEHPELVTEDMQAAWFGTVVDEQQHVWTE